jgi:tryptophan synthase beta chain
MSDTRIMLGEEELPRAWYNILPDLPAPLPPPLHPVTREPVGPGDLAPIFPAGLIEQEMSSEQWIAIPDEVRDIYKLWRPTPMQRAARLERFLRTPARIYFKNESVSPAGSHKPNTAVAQAYYNKREGVKRLATETGAGQWGSALSLACRFFGLECTVYMVKVSFEQKPYRRLLMETWGATVHPSPSARTRSGASVLAADPGSPGSLGIAISEAVEDAATHDDTRYALGSVLNHVVLHQTVIGLEARAQLEKIGVEPDVLIGCVGGGSNFSGFVFPFLAGDMTRSRRIRLVAVEPKACPSLTEGLYRYDHGDAVGLTPLLKMHTLGRDFVPPAIHAGGLRYHGDAPLLCLLRDAGLIEAVAVDQPGVFEAAVTFARTEGIVPAPESAHAIKIAIDEAVRCRETGAKKTICFALSGHGHFDLAGYSDYLDGKMNAAA